MWRLKFFWRELLSTGRNMDYGEHSEIPKCCILYYVLFWRWLYLYKALFRQHHNSGFSEYYADLVRAYEKRMPLRQKRIKNLKRARVLFRPSFKYVPCPICLLRGNLVEPRDCAKENCDCKWNNGS